MLLYIKQKVFSFGDKFTVKNESGEDVYQVKGKPFSFTHHLTIYNKDGSIAATLHKKIFQFRPRYYIEIAGTTYTLAQKFTFLTRQFYYEQLPIEVKGDFISHFYTITDTNLNTTIMTVSKEWFSWGDSYQLNIPEPKNALLGLATLVAIDAMIADSSNK